MTNVELADGTLVPQEAVDALYALEQAWPGATLSQARPAIVAAVMKALGVREEQYRSAMCPDDQDYDMVRLCSNWRPRP